ncbi:hypothetical protein ACFQ2B_37125 [Streptomyces stramineus]
MPVSDGLPPVAGPLAAFELPPDAGWDGVVGGSADLLGDGTPPPLLRLGDGCVDRDGSPPPEEREGLGEEPPGEDGAPDGRPLLGAPLGEALPDAPGEGLPEAPGPADWPGLPGRPGTWGCPAPPRAARRR